MTWNVFGGGKAYQIARVASRLDVDVFVAGGPLVPRPLMDGTDYSTPSN